MKTVGSDAIQQEVHVQVVTFMVMMAIVVRQQNSIKMEIAQLTQLMQ